MDSGSRSGDWLNIKIDKSAVGDESLPDSNFIWRNFGSAN